MARFLETGDLTAQQRLELVLEAAQLGVWEADLRTGELRISERLAAMYGLPASATNPPRDVWRDRIHPEDRDRVEEAFRATLGGGRDYAAEYRAFDHEGRTRWLASRATIVRDAAGRSLRLPDRPSGLAREDERYLRYRSDPRQLLPLPNLHFREYCARRATGRG